MPVPVTIDQILRLAPNIRASYREAFQNGQAVLEACGIAGNPLRVAHFMAQMLHESGGFTIQFENLNYSAARLSQVFPNRFQPKGPLDPAQYAHDPEKLANEVYGGRMGNALPGDGFTFRGRGLLQITGRASYAEAREILRRTEPQAPDFTQDPDAVLQPAWCLKVAAAEWAAKGCNERADRDSLRAVTKAINGGYIGLAERAEWLRRTRHVWS